MSDSAFEKSIIALTIVMALLIVAGLALNMLTGTTPVPFIALAIVLEIGGGGLLLYFWGKSYMARR